MKLRQFVSILGIVALVAIIYSPSTIGLSASPTGDGGTGPADTSASGTSTFLAYLHQAGYRVVVANTSTDVVSYLQDGNHQKLVYVLIGPDLPLSSSEVSAFTAGYYDGDISALVAEGNNTNPDLLATFGVSTTGRPVIDPASSFQDKQVFTVDLALDGTDAVGVIDIASPLTVDISPLASVASSPASSHDLGDSAPGPRTIVAAGTTSLGSRAVIITDSGPFTNFLFGYSQGNVDEKSFVAAMVSYVDPGKGTTILLDASHYVPKPPKLQAGLPIGPLVAYALEQSVSGLNSYYSSFPSQVAGFLGSLGIHVSDGVAVAIVALIILISVYGAITRWFAPEKKGKDDQPLPTVERTIVAESKARIDFLQTSRSKGRYVATLAQLYDLLDAVVLAEFGQGISTVEEGSLASRVGVDEARRAKQLFLSLSKLREYAAGQRALIFPPVLRWRALTERSTREAEDFLNLLGMTITGDEDDSGRRKAADERVIA